MALTGKQRRYLRSLGHALAPVVQLGKEGVSRPVIAAVNDALETHELIKVKVGQNAHVDRHGAGERLAQETHSELAQVLGSTLLLYRRHPDEPKIKLPKSKPADD